LDRAFGFHKCFFLASLACFVAWLLFFRHVQFLSN